MNINWNQVAVVAFAAYGAVCCCLTTYICTRWSAACLDYLKRMEAYLNEVESLQSSLKAIVIHATFEGQTAEEACEVIEKIAMRALGRDGEEW